MQAFYTQEITEIFSLQEHPDLHGFFSDQFSAFSRKIITEYLLVLDLPLNLVKSAY